MAATSTVNPLGAETHLFVDIQELEAQENVVRTFHQAV